MADNLSPERRSLVMSHIKGKETSIEIKVRKWLFHNGFRYRKNVSALPGTPDIVLGKYRTVIFVHGCFWHRHPGCKKATIPKTNTAFWKQKLGQNVQRDQKNIALLEKYKWHIIVLWQCELEKNFEATMLDVKNTLRKTF